MDEPYAGRDHRRAVHHPNRNPFLKQPRDVACKTRFKMWWRLVGSAVEHAAMLFEPETPVDFQSLFLAQDDEDEDSTSLAKHGDHVVEMDGGLRRRRCGQGNQWATTGQIIPGSVRSPKYARPERCQSARIPIPDRAAERVSQPEINRETHAEPC